MAGTGTCPTLAKPLLGAARKSEVGMGMGGGGLGPLLLSCASEEPLTMHHNTLSSATLQHDRNNIGC